MLSSHLRPLFFSLDPEHAHHLTLNALKLLQASRLTHVLPPSHPRLSQKLWGLRFPNPADAC